MAERNDIVYDVVGGFESPYSPGEIGLGQDFSARELILAEQERAKQPGYKAAPPSYVSGVSAIIRDDGGLFLNFGGNKIWVNPEDVDELAQVCAKAIQTKNANSHQTYLRNKSTIF